MTKAEELTLLEKIDALINSADLDSYIAMTFAGIVDVCRRNIENDFGNEPVRDLEDAREMLNAEERRHDETKKQLAEAQKMCNDAMDERDELRVKLKDNAEMGEKLLRLEHENQALQTHLDEKDEEIAKLKHIADSWEKNAHDVGELYCKLEDECAEMTAEIRKLKAEIVRMRMERMDENAMAHLYDRMNEED